MCPRADASHADVAIVSLPRRCVRMACDCTKAPSSSMLLCEKTIGRAFARPFSQSRATPRLFWMRAIQGRSTRSSLIARGCARCDEAVDRRESHYLSKRKRFVEESVLWAHGGTPRACCVSAEVCLRASIFINGKQGACRKGNGCQSPQLTETIRHCRYGAVKLFNCVLRKSFEGPNVV